MRNQICYVKARLPRSSLMLALSMKEIVQRKTWKVSYRDVFCLRNMIQWVLPIVEYMDFQVTVSWSILRAGDQRVWDSLGILPFVDITSWCFAMFRSYWRWFQMLISSQQIGCDNSAPRKTSDFRLKDPTTDISSLSNFWIPIPIPNLSLSSLRIELIKSIPKVKVPQVRQVRQVPKVPISTRWPSPFASPPPSAGHGSRALPSVPPTDAAPCRPNGKAPGSCDGSRATPGGPWSLAWRGMGKHGKT